MPVHLTLERNAIDVVERMVARHRRDLPEYRRLPAEAIRDDVTSVSLDAVHFYARWLRENAEPAEAELDRLGRSAALRAAEGLSLDAVLAAYLTGFQGIFNRLTAPAGSADLQDVRALATRLFDFARAATGAVAKGYIEEVRAGSDVEDDVRRTLLRALLQNAPTTGAIPSDGFAVALEYIVLSLAVARHPDEEEQGVSSTVVTRRMVRRVQAVLESATDDQALTSLDGGGGIVLVPVGAETDWSAWSGVVRTLGEAAGSAVTAAAALASPADVPAAARQTGELLDVVRWFELPPGLYRIEDLLVEYQLTRPSQARAKLAAVLDPVADNPELFATLTHYLAHEHNRRRTARLLHVHPNTVDYRLRRIGELTGIDLGKPTGMQRITAALAARRAETQQSFGSAGATQR
ncbi:PucR family transcriptional regulator [Amycolatopsis sp. NPDC088138]|uniref:PucR family transcriptional regulator n=1 Tax=Amycolatopsis sp. NPDC088138 TaxID=3363938 RepID=UPI0037FD2588